MPDAMSPKGSPNTYSKGIRGDPDVPMSNALNHVQSSPLASTEAEAIERIRATLHGSKPVRTDDGEGLPTSNDHSEPTVGVVPDSDYESEVEAPKASDVQLYDNDMFCSIEPMDDSLWDSMGQSIGS